MKEVSSALRKLRSKYDEIYRIAQKKQRDLEQLKVSHYWLDVYLLVLRKTCKRQRKRSRESPVILAEPIRTL